MSLAETAHAAEFSLADGVIVTGTSTGRQTEPGDVRSVAAAIRIPTFVGSGVTPSNIAQYPQADGFIIVTPEYNHGYPAVLKNALDYTYFAWARKAVAFVSWGSAGGARGVEQLRSVAIELDMVPIRFAVHIPNPWFIQGMSGIDTDVNRQAGQALLDNLTWWTGALKAARK